MRPLAFVFNAVVAATAQLAALQPAHPPRPGVKNRGIQLPIERLTPDAVFPVPGAPDWLALGDDAVWVSNAPKGSVSRLDATTNRVTDTIATGKEPCAGLAIGFSSLWVPNCGDSTVARVDLTSRKVSATFRTGIADSEGGVAIAAGSFWILTDKNGTLARIDPDTNKVVAEVYVARGSVAVAGGDDALWVTSAAQHVVTRVDPHRNLVTATIPVGREPRFLAVGEGAVWTLNQGDGSVSRIDPATNKVVATIDVGVPGPGGEIAAGEGSVWVTVFDVPLSRIDPETNTVVQQFVGPGGDSVRVGLKSVWLTNLRAGNVWRLDPRRIAATLPR
jgi:virginiamycin B lyase